MSAITYTLAVCTAMVWLCSGQSASQSAARLEEPQQTLEEAKPPVRDVLGQQNFDAVGQQARLDTSYLPAMEAGQAVDSDEGQADLAKDDMRTDEFRFWGYRPYYGRRWGWGWGWNAYPRWGWNGYRRWGDYGYGRSYPFYGYYW